MLTLQEQLLYFWLSAFWAEGAGEIVDLGCFAGGSTARLAEGAQAAGLKSGLHGFDRFTAHERAKEGLLYANGVAPFEGEDILPLARQLLAPWGKRITLHRGEIDQMTWAGGPIEILAMDASKRAETGDRMAASFLPHLIAGRSLLVQQDLLHWSQPWVVAQMELLSAYFRPLAHVERDTVVYLCVADPDPTAIAIAQTAELSDEEVFDLIKSAQARFASLGWGLTERLEQMVLGLLANPGQRAAHRFKRP
ncbi:hypothetical protein R3X27_20120 [Tropicimonas sp. TH_r6]|uniref:hypothetical protein n=1 Tax=Tropicimonas sp. TH_r6 TaxID=3082085 RepID=UPI0029532E26|nr:hypothetical protein [Tropicimonas sp. TH_r6]MDV7144994.1 hypothetical protein [Tropicimonas sp. TH_r6]